MSSAMVITVLCPNGRRQPVKVSPNSSILEILEEACRKQGFNPNEYDLSHYERRVDLSLSVRFANLPNNAVLEMNPAKEARSEGTVTVAVQLESGERLMDSFPPSSTVLNILEKCFSSCGKSLENESSVGEPVCIYMRQKFTGDQIKTTTLRSLGLTKGKAAFRLMFRPLQSLNEQAHVSVPLSKPQTPDDDDDDVYDIATRKTAGSEVNDQLNIKQARFDIGIWEDIPSFQGGRTTGESSSAVPNIEPDHPDAASLYAKSAKFEEQSTWEPMQLENSSDAVSGSVDNYQVVDRSTKLETPSDSEVMDMENSAEQDQEVQEIGEIKYLGPRNAVLFNLEDISEVKKEDFPPEFFELTVNDIRYLMDEYKRTRNELENEPLLLKSQREARMLQQLACYKQSVIRIYFPDKLVLQGTFIADETVQTVMDFVRNFLEDRNLSFCLYITPPKVKLLPEKTLLEVRLAPAAVVYFGCEVQRSSYLHKDFKDQISDPRAAGYAAVMYRQKCELDQTIVTPPIQTPEATENSQVPSAPTEEIEAQTRFINDTASNQGAIPKWFKLGTK